MTPILSQFDLITAYGRGIDALWNGLMESRTAIAPTDRFKDRNFVSNQAALVPDLHVEPRESRVMAMLRPLLADLVGKLDPQTPLILATTVGEIEFLEQKVIESAVDTSGSFPSTLLDRIKKALGLIGPAGNVFRLRLVHRRNISCRVNGSTRRGPLSAGRRLRLCFRICLLRLLHAPISQ